MNSLKTKFYNEFIILFMVGQNGQETLIFSII